MSAALDDALAGRLLDQRYRVESCVARGGMATVYRATDTRLDRLVALKIMHAELARHEEFVSRFIREAKSAARLTHPNVVAVYDQGQADGYVYLTMEFVDGDTLRDQLAARGRFAPREALEIMQPILAALGAAHRVGLVHRDVKPENVLIRNEGPYATAIKVADFGLARLAEAEASISLAGMLVGTASYLAPEQIERGIADARSDVYSAGIVLYELLTGVKPYTGTKPLEIAYQHVHRDVPAPSELVPDTDPALDALVARATSRDPSIRPADATALLADLGRTYSSLPDEALDGDANGLATATTVPVDGGRPHPERTLVEPEEPPGMIMPRKSPRDPHVYAAPGPARRRWRPGRGLIAFAAVIVLAGGGAGFAWWYGSGRFTTIPSVLTLDGGAARARLQADGLTPLIGAGEYSETIPKGDVVTSSPGPGSRVASGGKVTLRLSLGPERHAVPPLAGDTLGAATAQLTTDHLAVGTVSQRYDATVPSGEVISSSPAPGTLLRPNDVVNLTISEGPHPVPKVLAMPVSQAQAELRADGFTNVVVIDLPIGDPTVQSQSPDPGTIIPYGSRITLYAY